MCCEKSLKEIFLKLNEYTQLLDLNSAGNIGEVVAQIILLKAFDKVNSQFKTISKAYTVTEFLTSLLGIDQYKLIQSDINKEIKEGIICFNHFIRKEDDLNFNDVLPGFIGRAAAGQFKKGYPHFDLFIPIVLTNDNITYIFIQVKNHEILGAAEAVQILENMNNPQNKTFPGFFENGKKLARLTILMSLGDKKDHSVRNYKLKKSSFWKNKIFYSLNHLSSSKLFNQEVLEYLEMLLNSDRLKLIGNKLFDPDVITKVAVGSIKF